jgi:hypothetical protein
MIVPDKTSTKDQLKALTVELQSEFGLDNVVPSLALDGTVLFWSAPLTPDQAANTSAYSLVCLSVLSINLRCHTKLGIR